jgi:predicted permease
MKRFFRKLARRRNLDREIESELAFHRAMAEADGNPTRLGNDLLIREAAGDPWRFTWIESLWRDAVYAARSLRRSPTLALVAVAAVALGVGCTTAIFSLVNAVLLKPAPVPDAKSFVVMSGAATPLKFAAWRQQSGILHDVAAYMPGAMNYDSAAAGEQVESAQVSADAFSCWGVTMLHAPTEDVPGGPHLAVVGEAFWQRHFAGDAQVAGKTISLNGDVYTVIGVAAPNAFLLEQGSAPDVYVPFQIDLNSRDQTLRFRVTARLMPGIGLTQANARLGAAAAQLRAAIPNALPPATLPPNDSLSAERYNDAPTRGSESLLMVLLGAVCLVLLIACANVANLLLVRAESRRREIAIRASIGAGRGRIIRQLLTESLLLSFAGGVLGSLLGFAGIRALLAVNTAGLPRVGEDGAAVGIDWRVLLFAVAISTLTGVVFGLFPALKGSRADLNAVLKDGGGRSGLRHSKARAVLVVSEVGLAVILLIGSALLIRTFVALYSVNLGFDPNSVITMRTRIQGPAPSAARVAQTMREGLTRIRSLPGVESATATYFIPLQTAIGSTFDIVGRPAAGQMLAGWTPVATDYFEVLKVPLRRGRVFTDQDDEKSTPVVVINETMARLYWKGADPLNDRILIARDGGRERRIIGVAGDVVDTQLSNAVRPAMYVPQAQIADAMNALLARVQPVAWMVRTRGEPGAVVPAIREQLRQATGWPAGEVQPMARVEAISIARQRFNMLLMSVFGAAALLLAALGIYGLMAFSVEQRRREIGIRLALGADAGRVKRKIVIEGLTLALAGALIGAALALDLTRFLASFLFGVHARDPLVFLSVPVMLIAVALFAVWIPASRASRVDPVKALRYE